MQYALLSDKHSDRYLYSIKYEISEHNLCGGKRGSRRGHAGQRVALRNNICMLKSNKNRTHISSPVVMLTVVVLSCVVLWMLCLGIFAAKVFVDTNRARSLDVIYQHHLGINASQTELVRYLNVELKGLNHQQVIDRFKSWGEVLDQCPKPYSNFGQCRIQVAKFLGTTDSYTFSLLYRNQGLIDITIPDS